MTVTKQFKAEIAHKLDSSYSEKCQNIHGHSYLFEITLESSTLNDDGMVMDFGEVKDTIGSVFDTWDHSFMFYTKDSVAPMFRDMAQLHGLRMIELDYNPTAENMAHHIFRICIERSLPVKEVRVQETKTGWAVVDRPKIFVGEVVAYYNT